MHTLLARTAILVPLALVAACNTLPEPAATGSIDPTAGRPLQRGQASWYGGSFNGRRTASGETFQSSGMTAAHRTLPFGTRVRVVHEGTGRSVVVRINDRGPFHGGRIIDLAHGPAKSLGLTAAGSAFVSLHTIE